MKYLVYPGCCCTQKTTSKAYRESLLAVWRHLNIEIEELEDWNCCGATAYMAIDEYKAFGLAARNLAIAESQLAVGDKDVNALITPCSACYMVLNKTQHYINEYPEVHTTVMGALDEAGLSYTGSTGVRHPLDVFLNEYDLGRLKSQTRRSLAPLKVASYYGCLLVRPYATFDDPVNPTSMDRLFSALGAETIDWPLKTRCCGGSLMGTLDEVGMRLNYILLKEAKERGADVIATACPFCQFNLECFQKKINKAYGEDITIPVVFFSQLIGLALGIPESKLGFKRLFVPFSMSTYTKGGVHVQG
ncbi:MAG TPA: CoB--CoM heterodisulfide reductase iron-sulfur subunit B family protein [Thermoanaerobaculia bacterium]|nr:CoB--CoM heterodisulfide reductase iron-sulfur subunit B family protein [Thermoanaerobaculia bacterium]HUM28648.1 CoB--CoM heterodisulfide reductase iron-sulfur subunit B family protein [Thermoanaerobaculia bacterium]HXK66744.1 CoB--CoM heterodisulfide reductase iron-sulfur subunit B family protein [Thermoanaerobaculia bacterium]